VGLRAKGNDIIGTDADFGDQVTAAGIIIKDNSKKSQGITPRWFRVHSVGDEVQDLEPDTWVLVAYGRWTESWKFEGRDYWRLDPEGCLATSITKPETLYYNRNVATAERMTR
jgi:hypothetical protein